MYRASSLQACRLFLANFWRIVNVDYLVVEQSQGAVKEVCGIGGMGRRDRSQFIRLAEQEGLVSRFEERDCLSIVIDHC